MIHDCRSIPICLIGITVSALKRAIKKSAKLWIGRCPLACNDLWLWLCVRRLPHRLKCIPHAAPHCGLAGARVKSIGSVHDCPRHPRWVLRYKCQGPLAHQVLSVSLTSSSGPPSINVGFPPRVYGNKASRIQDGAAPSFRQHSRDPRVPEKVHTLAVFSLAVLALEKSCTMERHASDDEGPARDPGRAQVKRVSRSSRSRMK